MAQPKNTNDGMAAALPLLAQAALGSNADPQLAELLKELVNDQLEQRRKLRARQERLAASAVQAAQDNEAQKLAQQRACNHLKQDDTTRLAGQYLSGNGQLALVCMFCGKEFHLPPLAGQEAPPKHLMPSGDSIGG
jgi:hypothetical protein